MRLPNCLNWTALPALSAALLLTASQPTLLAQTAPTAPANSAPTAPDAAPATTPPTFGQSLALRTDRIVMDSTHTALGWLAQTTPVAYTSKGALQLRLALYPTDGSTTVAKDMGTVTIFGDNLAVNPWPFPLNVRGVPDGSYRCVGELWDGDTSLAKFDQPVVLVADLDEKQADFENRLAKISGHDGAAAAVRYPFDLARVMNIGKRVYGSGTANPEFGLSQDNVPHLYDFTAGLKKSGEVLAALEAGHDPLWGARGETVQYYYLPEADEILPYHVYVPSSWDGKTPLPMVLILHGNSRDQDFYFDRDGHIIPNEAEKHGFLLVAPLGYAPNAGYNYVPYGRAATGPRGVVGATSAPQNFGPLAANRGRGGRGAAPTGFGGVNGSTTPQLVRTEWSEEDAMHVFALIKQEYPIDPNRVFLFGYSAGGQGSHYIGPKYAENWAAIAIGGSNAAPGNNADPALNYPFAKLKNIPVMLYYGTADTPNINPTNTMANAMKQNGIDVVMKAYEGADHDHAPSAAVADVFDFFAAHPRK